MCLIKFLRLNEIYTFSITQKLSSLYLFSNPLYLVDFFNLAQIVANILSYYINNMGETNMG